MSGLQVVYNLTNPSGSRVDSVKVQCAQCAVPVYEKLNETAIYQIVLTSFLREGGDGFTLFMVNVNLKKSIFY